MSTAGSHAGSMGGGDRSLRDDMDAIKSDLNNLKGDLRHLASDASTAGRHAARQARERLGEVAGQVGDKARTYYDQAKTRGREATEALEHKIEENPLMSVGIAFGIGLVVGALITRR